MEWQTQDLLIPAAHPSAAGHFPGNPIVPGALLLDALVAAIAGDQGDIVIQSVKFLQPVCHGEPLQLRWQEQRMGQFRFECRVLRDASLVLTGTLATSTIAA